MALTVLDILTTRGFNNSAIVGGWGGLGRRVTSVTVAEVPDAGDWLRGGELVLSTCYFLKDDASGLVGWLEALTQGGAVGVAIKPQRFLGEIPAAARAAAERLAIPLVSLPFSATWPPIIQSVSEVMIGGQDLKAATASWRRELLWAVQDRLGFPSMAEILADHTHCAVIIQGSDHTVLAAALPPGPEVRSQLEAILQHRQAQGDINEASQRQTTDDRRLRLTWTPENLPPYTEHLFELLVEDEVKGYLSLIPVRSSETIEQLPIVPYARALLAMAFDHLRTAVERERNLRRRLLRQFLAGDGPSTGEAQTRLSAYLRPTGGVAVLGVLGLPSGSARTELTEMVEIEAGTIDNMALACAVEQGHAILLHAAYGSSLRALVQQLVDKLGVRVRQRWPGARLCVGVGPQAQGPNAYRQSFAGALQCLRVARNGNSDQTIIVHEDLGVFKALAAGDRLASQQFQADILDPLEQFDRERDAYLLATLRAFFACDCNVQRAANSLFIHPNTLRYRLKQVEKLTGLDMQRFEDQTTLWLALKLQSIRD